MSSSNGQNDIDGAEQPNAQQAQQSATSTNASTSTEQAISQPNSSPSCAATSNTQRDPQVPANMNAIKQAALQKMHEIVTKRAGETRDSERRPVSEDMAARLEVKREWMRRIEEQHQG